MGSAPSSISAVKHFRFELRGKRRIHQTPGPVHINACRPWLVAEFARLEPELVVVPGWSPTCGSPPARWPQVEPGRRGYAAAVRLTDFWTRLEQAFGPAYAKSLAADHAFTELDGRTIDEAFAQGEETVRIWRAVVAAYPDRVPARLR